MKINFTENRNRIDELLGRLETLLLSCWNETGFGKVTIESERIPDDKIRVFIKGSTHYRFVISDQEVQQRLRMRRG